MSLRSTVKPREGNNVGTGTPRSAGPALPSRVLVTGALGGIGLPTVRLLRDLGAHVVAVDLPTRAEATSRHPDDLAGVTYVECDITDERRVAAMIAAWTDDDLPQAVCSLAGAVISAPMVEQSSSDMRTVFDLNFHAQVGLAQSMTRRWLGAGVAGNFIFVSSWVQDVPWPGIGPYAASKAALRSIARTFALEHATDGIRYNLRCPRDRGDRHGQEAVGHRARLPASSPARHSAGSPAVPPNRWRRPSPSCARTGPGT